ncbi:MAG: ATPase, partial [Magnetococcales bacterium]|nr:ATPase [Magnetococcales bacterium]
EDGNARPITYELAINLDRQGRPYVVSEGLRQRRKGQSHGHPFSFLYLREGRGFVWSGAESYAPDSFEKLSRSEDGDILWDPDVENPESDAVELSDQRYLGIVTLGSLKGHTRISKFRDFLTGWYLSYFSPNAARAISKAGTQKHLNESGSNIGNVVQFLERKHKGRIQKILKQISDKIPNIGTGLGLFWSAREQTLADNI